MLRGDKIVQFNREKGVYLLLHFGLWCLYKKIASFPTLGNWWSLCKNFFSSYVNKFFKKQLLRLFCCCHAVTNWYKIKCADGRISLTYVFVFERAYENSLFHAHKLFSVYFDKFVMKAYENTLHLNDSIAFSLEF